MAFKTFVAGDVLTAAELNTYLMEQAVIRCTSTTRPSAPAEGMTVYETDTDKLLVYSGAAWKQIADIGGPDAYTPVITASTTNPVLGTGGIIDGQFDRTGARIDGWARAKFGTAAASAGSGNYRISTPVAGVNAGSHRVVGAGYLYDASVDAAYPLVAYLADGAYFQFYVADFTAGSLLTHLNPISIDLNDEFSFSFTYWVAA